VSNAERGEGVIGVLSLLFLGWRELFLGFTSGVSAKITVIQSEVTNVGRFQ
jgi:hypothetical protein